MDDEVVNSIEHSIDDVEEILKELFQLRSHMEKHQKKVSISKTVGASASVVGGIGASISLLSLINLPGAIVGGLAAAGTAGGVVSMGATIGDAVVSRDAMIKLERIKKKYNNNMRHTETLVRTMLELSMELGKMVSKPDDVCFDKLWKELLELKGIIFDANSDYLSLHISGFTIQSLAAVLSMSSVPSTDVMPLLQKSIPQPYKDVVNMYGGKIGFTPGQMTLRTAGAAFILVVAIYDMHSAINSWYTKHPTLKEIDETINFIEDKYYSLRRSYIRKNPIKY